MIVVVIWRALRPLFSPVRFPSFQAASASKLLSYDLDLLPSDAAARGAVALIAAIEGVGQGDLGNVLGVLVLDDLGIDEEGHRHLDGLPARQASAA